MGTGQHGHPDRSAAAQPHTQTVMPIVSAFNTSTLRATCCSLAAQYITLTFRYHCKIINAIQFVSGHNVMADQCASHTTKNTAKNEYYEYTLHSFTANNEQNSNINIHRLQPAMSLGVKLRHCVHLHSHTSSYNSVSHCAVQKSVQFIYALAWVPLFRVACYSTAPDSSHLDRASYRCTSLTTNQLSGTFFR